MLDIGPQKLYHSAFVKDMFNILALRNSTCLWHPLSGAEGQVHTLHGNFCSAPAFPIGKGELAPDLQMVLCELHRLSGSEELPFCAFGEVASK